MKIVKVAFAVVVAFIATTMVALVAAFQAKQRIQPTEDEAADEMTAVGVLGPMYFRSTAPALRRATIECWFGGGVVDLRDAQLDPAGARLEVRAVFGGAQVVVPETWQVELRVAGIGGAGDGRPKIERAVDAPVLTIEGLAIFGGFGVTSELSESDAARLESAVKARAGFAGEGSTA
jgi:hypothetical protein